MAEKEIEQRYGNVRDTALRYGMTEPALRGRVLRKVIPFIKEGGRIYFDWRRLDRERAKHRYGPEEDRHIEAA